VAGLTRAIAEEPAVITRSRTAIALSISMCLMIAGSVVAQNTAPAGSATVPELIAVLRSDAAAFDKAKACQGLAARGDARAVAALVPLLAEEELACYARSALEAIADPSAGAALVEALGQLRGGLLVGAINSVGARREARGVDILSKLVTGDDPEAAAAALAALGRIGTPEAVRVLRRALEQAPSRLRAEAADACLVCGDALLDRGDRGEAVGLYRRVRAARVPEHIRLAALGRQMVALGPRCVAILLRHLRSGDTPERTIALRAARDIPDPEVTRALARELPSAGPALQVQLIEALAGREGEAARSAIERLIADDVREVRLAALRAVGPVDVDRLRFVPLFDGRTFEGWEGDTVGSFRVEDGAIVGGNLNTPIPRNEFLCTTRTYANFVLRLECKVVSANGGIQFRSQRVPGSSEVSGYQADMDSSGTYWGCLYDESRRGMLVQADPAATSKVVKQDDWNHYEIRCEGNHIQLLVNDLRTVDYVESDPTIPRSGVIGVQVHAGPASETWYRNIRIAELP